MNGHYYLKIYLIRPWNKQLLNFLNGKLYDKKFTFEAHSIKDENTIKLEKINQVGVIGK